MLKSLSASFAKSAFFAFELIVITLFCAMMLGVFAFGLLLFCCAMSVAIGAGPRADLAIFPMTIVYDMGVPTTLVFSAICFAMIVPIKMTWDMFESAMQNRAGDQR